MPLIATIPSEIIPGESYTAWVWCPRLKIDAGNQLVVIEFEAYASQAAAYGGGKPVARFSRILAGKEFRNFVRENLTLWTALTSAVDSAALEVPALADAAHIEGQDVPEWASQPVED